MLLEVRGLTKRFGGLTAVRSVDLELGDGTLFGLIGPNGAGKTTLFNLIAGYFKPTAGTVRFDGHDITRLPPYDVASRGLCRTFQVVKPFGNLSVLENTMVGAFTRERSKRAARAVAESVIDLVGLTPWADAPARSLPIGLRKRLEVARALATRPRLLLLDEVMSGVTPTELQALIDLVRRLHGDGLTILMIEHIMAAIMPLSERIAVLHHGEKIAEGTPSEIARDPRVIDAYLGEEYLIA